MCTAQTNDFLLIVYMVFSRIKVFLIVILNFFPLLFVYLKMAFNAVKAEATGALIDFIDEMIPALLQDFKMFMKI